MALEIFWFCLTLSLVEKLKNSKFELPKIPQTLNFNNNRKKCGNYISLSINRNFYEYSSKNGILRTIFTLTVYKVLFFESRLVLGAVQQIPGSKMFGFWQTCLKSYCLTSLEVSKELQYFVILLNAFSNKKFEKLNF